MTMEGEHERSSPAPSMSDDQHVALQIPDLERNALGGGRGENKQGKCESHGRIDESLS
jgi:hypothetical protein